MRTKNISNNHRNNRTFVFILLLQLVSLTLSAQQLSADTSHNTQAIQTVKVSDLTTGAPIKGATIQDDEGRITAISDSTGTLKLWRPFLTKRFIVSMPGYQQQTISVSEMEHTNQRQIKLRRWQTSLNEVQVKSKRSKPYRNKDNPAVELIRKVIAHKEENQPTSTAFLQYHEYERISLAAFDLPKILTERQFFQNYRFMIDSTLVIDGKRRASMPVFLTEKLSRQYYRREPEKKIELIEAESGINMIKFVDTVGTNLYLNRLYGNELDIYQNNLLVISRQFLSPIADHSPNYYKFFIVDTVQSAQGPLVQLAFTPRIKGDLLFDGHLLVTLDGHYAVAGCVLGINKQINLNFLRRLTIELNFKADSTKRYRLNKSAVRADFGLLPNGVGLYGQRTVVYTDYLADKPQPTTFYQGKAVQKLPPPPTGDTLFWKQHRTDTLTLQEAQSYARINRLQQMQLFKTATWIAGVVYGDYGNIGPKFQAGPFSTFVSYGSLEGVRFQFGGRTTPAFNRSIYLDGYAGYGTRDGQWKYRGGLAFSFNHTAPYQYPNNYIKFNYLYDLSLPGQDLAAVNNQAILSNFQTGQTNYWLYNRIFTASWVRDLENHLSFKLTLKQWAQTAAGNLNFHLNDAASTPVSTLRTGEISFGLRYAPHEQIIQRSADRHTIHSPYPIFNLEVSQGVKGLMNGQYSYTNLTGRIKKRFYLSQLGYGDATLLGGLILGQVPFPLLSIAPANQSLGYEPNAYNKMNYLEFISDHYAGFNYTHSFNGFFLNKIPLIKQLKWREYLSFKILYGGLRDENNPQLSQPLYQFPKGSNVQNGTYYLQGGVPYTEAGAGIGNIFKILRVDLIRRFTYLDHPGVSPYSIKLDFNLSL